MWIPLTKFDADVHHDLTDVYGPLEPGSVSEMERPGPGVRVNEPPAGELASKRGLQLPQERVVQRR